MNGVSDITAATPPEQCQIIGLPLAYLPSTKYTFTVVSTAIVSRKVYVSAGRIIGSSKSGPNTNPQAIAAEAAFTTANGDEHDHSAHAHRTRQLSETNWLDTESCFDCGRPSFGSVLFDWIAPESGNGTVTVAALCGGSSLGSGGAGFVAAAQHVRTTETYKFSSSLGHSCTPVPIYALDEYAMSGLQSKDDTASGTTTTAGGGHTMMMVFSAFDPLLGSPLYVLFGGWVVNDWGMYIFTLLVLFLGGIVTRLLRVPLAELVRRLHRRQEPKPKHETSTIAGTVSAGNVQLGNGNNRDGLDYVLLWVGFFVSQALNYGIMLVAMIMDVGFFLAIMFGLSTGFLLETCIQIKQTRGNKRSLSSASVHDIEEKRGGGGDIEMSGTVEATGVGTEGTEKIAAAAGASAPSSKLNSEENIVFTNDDIIGDCCG